MVALHQRERTMSSILSGLKFTNAQRPKRASPTIVRRQKLVRAILEQVEAVKSSANGTCYTTKQLKKIRDRETGNTTEILKERRIKEWWWSTDDGHTYLEIRYGWRAMELGKGKTAIDVGKFDDLIPMLNKLRLAVEAGELDDQIAAMAQQIGVKSQK